MNGIIPHAIYNLPISYTLLSSRGYELEFTGSLSYHVIDLERLREVTEGELEVPVVNTLLNFIIQQTINSMLKDLAIEELDEKRPIIINRLKVAFRNEFWARGLEFIDFQNFIVWSFDSGGT
ncbi:MAG: hypothetical protein ACFFE8_06160 [Candidatus Heimdallarchaeota archaeon]